MSCNPGAGNYNILSFLDGNAVNITSPQAPANVVILDDVTAITLTVDAGPPTCNYFIQINGAKADTYSDQDLLQITNGPGFLWVINYQAEKQAYTIQFADNPSLAWTDPGGPTGDSRQLSLTTLQNPIPASQLFKFVPV